NYTLKLSVSTESELFEIVGITSSDEINIKFDYPGGKELNIEPEIDFEGESVAEGYCLGEFIFPESNTVRITGPETEVNKVERVVARASVEGKLRQNLTVEADLVALNSKGETVSYISFNRQNNKARITLPVYKIAQLQLTCGITGRPSDYVDNLPLKILVNPTVAEIAIPEKKLEGMETFEIKTVDFSELRAGVNSFEVKAEEIPNAVVVDGTESFMVTINADGMDEKTVKADFEVGYINHSSDMNVELVKFDIPEITFVGPVSSVNAITSQSVKLTADLSGIPSGSEGEFSVPVKVASGDCWIYGQPTVTVSVS
ncbi:MAG: CdaR family protein, partial [Acutalibacteraceae bacterium]|nr:CdaR family protein [Acutalibacteraceae bacterium]